MVLSTLAEYYNIEEMMNPIDYYEKDWSKEPYSGGCPVSSLTTGVMKYYNEGLQAPHGRYNYWYISCYYINSSLHCIQIMWRSMCRCL